MDGMKGIFDQSDIIAQKLATTPFSRRAQAVTWKVWQDTDCYDPPCLQSIWCRILPDAIGTWTLNTNALFRSNDAYKAAFMNMSEVIINLLFQYASLKLWTFSPRLTVSI